MSSQEGGTLVLVCRLHIRLNLQMMSDRGKLRTVYSVVRFAERLNATRDRVGYISISRRASEIESCEILQI